MLFAFILPSSLALGTNSRPRQQPSILVGDMHASEEEIFNGGMHMNNLMIKQRMLLEPNRMKSVQIFTFDDEM